jgi:hypothetical protein
MFHRIVQRIALLLAPLLVLALGSPAAASWFHGSRSSGCCSSGCSCGAGCCQMAPVGGCTYQTVQKTIMVPTMVTEMRSVNCTEYRTEQRQRTCTVYKIVPETKMVQYQYTVLVPETRTETVNCVQYKTEARTRTCMVSKEIAETKAVEFTYTVAVPETRTRTVEYTVCKPVMSTQTEEYSVCVPYTETRHGTREVCKMAPTPSSYCVCVDQGHWEDRPIPSCASSCGCGCAPRTWCGRCCSPCGGCESPPVCRTCRVWVPNWVRQQVPCTVMKPVVESVPCDYQVTLYKQETRTRPVQVCHLVAENRSEQVQYTVCVPQTRTGTRNVVECKCVAVPVTETYNVCIPYSVPKQVEYTVCVPQTRTASREVTVCKCVPEQHTETYAVCVPYCVRKQVPVQVCRMVPQTVTCQVPVAAPCGCCGCGN